MIQSVPEKHKKLAESRDFGEAKQRKFASINEMENSKNIHAILSKLCNFVAKLKMYWEPRRVCLY